MEGRFWGLCAFSMSADGDLIEMADADVFQFSAARRAAC
ncbi:hypothetical protein P186_2357 [Pyrobaculum ferrireducens]|uniref:Uncharacterized protein n=1 Tax=Pyrobaculum ferrireducens TaxID=1104324 RepID=G7VC59_9CREN|nr:hypothetical protein P186_2357 [Pyrobaculum ferrireducens]